MTLISRPDKMPEWASEDHTDPILPIPNVVEPETAKKKTGWFYKEAPPANWFNWILRYVYRWVAFLDDQRTNNNPVFGIDISATPNILNVNLTPAITQYTDGRLFILRVANKITGDSTLNINGLGAKQIIDLDELPLVGDELLANGMYMFIYSQPLDKFFLQAKPDSSAGSTGDHLITDASGERKGWIWVRNSTLTTIGDVTSGATIRANADCRDLFKWYWTFNAIECPIYNSNGSPSTRGVNSDADWTAHKRMAIPSSFKRVFAVHDEADAFRIGQVEGERTHALTAAENGAHAHSTSQNAHAHDCPQRTTGAGGGGGGWDAGSGAQTYGAYADIAVASSGSGTAHNNMQPTIYKNLYIKL